MHSSRMRTSRLLTVSRSIPCISGGVCQTPSYRETQGGGLPNIIPWMQTPHVGRPGGSAQPPPLMWSVMHAGNPTSPTMNKMTHRCKNITLSQTVFVGGKNGISDED